MPIPFPLFLILGCSAGIQCMAFDPQQCFEQAVAMSVEQQLPEVPPCQLVWVQGYAS